MTSSPRAINRLKERAVSDRAVLDSILDSSSLATVCAVDAEGLPQVIPTLHARDGDRIILHGSTGAGTLRLAAAGAPIAVCVARMDALVVADTLFDSSANYVSAVVTGVAQVITGDQAAHALTLMSEQVLPGRSREVPEHQPKELAATVVLELPITADNWTAKVRTGGPGGDADPAVWTGVVPLDQVWGTPQPAPGAPAEIPPSVRALVGGHTPGDAR